MISLFNYLDQNKEDFKYDNPNSLMGQTWGAVSNTVSDTASDILNVLKDVNQEYGTTIVMVTHDLDVIREIPRVITIKDGKTSLELVHRPSFRKDEDDVSREFVLVDGSGRLQIPQEYLDQLNIKQRVFVEVQDDKVVVWPEDHSNE